MKDNPQNNWLLEKIYKDLNGTNFIRFTNYYVNYILTSEHTLSRIMLTIASL